MHMEEILQEFSDKHPHIPVFLTNNEYYMDQAEIEYLPTTIISDGESQYRIEGECSYEELEDLVVNNKWYNEIQESNH